MSSEKEDEAREVDYLSRLWISPTSEVFMVTWDWHNQVKLIFMRAGLSGLFQPGKTIWIHWEFLCCLLYGILERPQHKLFDFFFLRTLLFFPLVMWDYVIFFRNICSGKIIFCGMLSGFIINNVINIIVIC